MSVLSDVIVPIITALCGGGAMKALEWWGKQRDAARAAALAITTQRVAADQSAAERRAAADQSATDKLLAAYEAQATQAEKRAADAAEGRLRVAEGLTSAGAAMRDLAAGVDRAADAIEDHDRREADSQARVDTQLARVLALLEELVARQRGTGEHRVSVTPRGDA